MNDDFTPDDIVWFIPRPSYDRPELAGDALYTLTECEAALETMTLTEIAAWVCDLITHAAALRIALHAAQDELGPLAFRVEDLHRFQSSLRAEVLRLKGAR